MRNLKGFYWRVIYIVIALASLAAAAGAGNTWDGGGP